MITYITINCKHIRHPKATNLQRTHNNIMSLKSPPEQLLLTPTNITNFPREIHLNILTFLRATDLSSLQRTSRTFNNRILIGEVVNHYANVVVSCCV